MIIIYVTDGHKEINVRDTDMKKTRMKFFVKTVGQCLFYVMKSSINCRNLEELQYKKYAHSICHRVREAIVTIIAIAEMVRKYVQLQQ